MATSLMFKILKVKYLAPLSILPSILRSIQERVESPISSMMRCATFNAL